MSANGSCVCAKMRRQMSSYRSARILQDEAGAAPCSAMAARWALPETSIDMIEPSTTRRPDTPPTRGCPDQTPIMRVAQRSKAALSARSNWGILPGNSPGDDS